MAVNFAQAGQGNAGKPQILPPCSKPHGHSYAEWSVKWWQWVFSLPANNSPIADTGPCSAGQSDHVWFLCGSFAPTTETRHGTIPPGTALFFPVYNAWADNTGCPYTDYSAAELVDMARGWVDSAPAMTCTIDGKRVKGLDNPVTSPYRVGPQVFCYRLARHDNLLANYLGPLFGVDLNCIADGTRVFPAAEDGVYLMLEPLCAGRHTIRFTVQDYLDITYDLKVLR